MTYFMMIYIISGAITFIALTVFEEARIESVAQRLFLAICPGINLLIALIIGAILIIHGVVHGWYFLGRLG